MIAEEYWQLFNYLITKKGGDYMKENEDKKTELQISWEKLSTEEVESEPPRCAVYIYNHNSC